jgi:hypothetical protein
MRNLSKSEKDKYIGKYCQYLVEINNRMDVMENIFKLKQEGKATNVYYLADLEMCFLQIRKIFELMMFGGLLVQEPSQLILSKRTHKIYKATEILAFVRKKNPGFFPKAVAYNSDSGFLEPRQQTSEQPHLTEKEFSEIYRKKIDVWMHANKEFGAPNDKIDDVLAEIISIHRMVVNLLIHHSLQLPTGDILIATNYDKDLKQPKATIWLLKGETPPTEVLFPD